MQKSVCHLVYALFNLPCDKCGIRLEDARRATLKAPSAMDDLVHEEQKCGDKNKECAED
ncbi:hypothetical protein GCM10010525_13190 [Glutamicibacter bergerei]|uniref:Uncharacterized protein n=1 Tax=Glutamicibacter ardleyensis TaxID=225894 RepID=A0ABQ2D4T0_9MICC|nr:hypothetical protein GCM10007173_00050 [Glutamicibacter ardleyensis]